MTFEGVGQDRQKKRPAPDRRPARAFRLKRLLRLKMSQQRGERTVMRRPVGLLCEVGSEQQRGVVG